MLGVVKHKGSNERHQWATLGASLWGMSGSCKIIDRYPSGRYNPQHAAYLYARGTSMAFPGLQRMQPSFQCCIDTSSCCLQGRTVLVIAHRLSTVKSADCIAVLEGGR